jgi:hypothetical protein
MRLVTHTLLLLVVLPGLFVDRELTLTLPLLALIAAPVPILVNSILDAVDRRRLLEQTRRDMAAETT